MQSLFNVAKTRNVLRVRNTVDSDADGSNSENDEGKPAELCTHINRDMNVADVLLRPRPSAPPLPVQGPLSNLHTLEGRSIDSKGTGNEMESDSDQGTDDKGVSSTRPTLHLRIGNNYFTERDAKWERPSDFSNRESNNFGPERRCISPETTHPDIYLRLEAGMKDLAQGHQILREQSEKMRSQLLALQDERAKLSEDKRDYTRSNALLTTKVDQPTECHEGVLAHVEEPVEELCRRLADAEEELRRQKAETREIENDRDAMARKCIMLSNIISNLKAKHREAGELFGVGNNVISRALTVPTNTVDLETARRVHGHDYLIEELPRVEPLKFRYEGTRRNSMMQARSAKLLKAQRRQSAPVVQQRHSDYRSTLQEFTHTKLGLNRATSLLESSTSTRTRPTGPRVLCDNPRGVDRYSCALTGVCKPLDESEEFEFKSPKDIEKIVRTLNAQLAHVACTAAKLTSPTMEEHAPITDTGETSRGKKTQLTYIQSLLRDILGVDLFYRFPIHREREDAKDNLNDLIERAIQAIFFYLLSAFAHSCPWPLVSPQENRSCSAAEPCLPTHEDMVSDTLLLINEMLCVAGIVGTKDDFDKYMSSQVESLWHTAARISESLKESDLETRELYGPLLCVSYRTKIEGT